ncbi:hypothetical protein ABJI51_12765 [Amycolatopsis sp. NEAU-NG30]|uniref:GNAT family N-acetyltransferase n=1 Tax=Amycolatopsis melonis TaxID=3156488 RepID=A0ABV0LCD2_9PSEU
MTSYTQRVATADWDAVAAEVDDYGCALLPTPTESARLATLEAA